MKALSVRQPWAWCIVNGWKDVENRRWSTSHRGPLLIHASKQFDHEGYDWIVHQAGSSLPSDILRVIPFVDPEERDTSNFDKGGVVGRVSVVAIADFNGSPWFVGPYGWCLRDAELLPFQPMRGQLGLFEVQHV